MQKKLGGLLFILFSALLLGWSQTQDPARAPDDQARAPSVYRLEHVHYDPVANTVQWGVAAGTMAGGQFEPSKTPVAVYSLNLDTGEMTRNGVKGQLTPGSAHEATEVFHSLAMVMQIYTQKWDESSDPAPRKSAPPETGQQDGIVKVSVDKN